MMKGTVSRRTALRGASALGALGVAGALGASNPVGAQGGVTLRWWSTQSVPAQLEAYKFQIAQFEAANPGIKVVFEPTSNETYAAQLAAAFASGGMMRHAKLEKVVRWFPRHRHGGTPLR